MATQAMSGGHLQIPADLKLVPVPEGTDDQQQVKSTKENVVNDERVDFTRYPVTKEAHEWLVQKREGCHAFINYWPWTMQVMVARRLGRQINLGEVKFFVGIDGEVNVGKCFIRTRQFGVQANATITRLEKEIEEQSSAIDELDPELYPQELKEEEKRNVSASAIDEIERLKEELQDPAEARFTRVWFVVPWMNADLLDELGANGGNVTKAFMAGDRLNAIYRSGCIYETDKGEVEFGGSPFFYDSDMKMVRIATSPLGRMTVIHPNAKNPKNAIKAYFGKGGEARQTILKQIFGVSSKELERRKKVAGLTGNRHDMGDRLVFNTNAAILELFGEVEVKQAGYRTGAGCGKK